MQRMSSLLGQNRRNRRCFFGAGCQVFLRLINLNPLRDKRHSKPSIVKNKFFELATLRKKPLSRDEIAQKFHKLAKNSRRISL